MRDAHDAAHGLVVHAHLIEDEEEGVVGGLGGIFLLDATVSREVNGLVEVDKAFIVIIRPARGCAVSFYLVVEQFTTYKTSPPSFASPRRCFPKFAKTSLSEHKNSIFIKIHRVAETVPRHLLSSDRSQVSGSNFLHVNLEFSILVCTFACKYLEIQCHETSAECCYYVAGTYVLHL